MKKYALITYNCCAIILLTSIWTATGFAEDDTTVDSSTEIGKKSVLEINQDVLENLSTEEQRWYKTFHNGILFFDGWSKISQEILEIYPADQVAEKSPVVQRLGIKIGTEWCKTNKARKIDNTLLKEWGKRLHESIAVGPQLTTRTLLEIEQEVDVLIKDSPNLSLVTPES